jgi:hypothetical protein
MFNGLVRNVLTIGSKKHVLADGALVKGWFLGNKSDVRSVIVDVQAGDLFSINVDTTDKRIIKAFEKCDSC